MEKCLFNIHTLLHTAELVYHIQSRIQKMLTGRTDYKIFFCKQIIFEWIRH